jgi:hypothetical protein
MSVTDFSSTTIPWRAEDETKFLGQIKRQVPKEAKGPTKTKGSP